MDCQPALMVSAAFDPTETCAVDGCCSATLCRHFASVLQLRLSFPKIPSARIRALRQNQSIILGDACMPSAA
jgi:hypothetical protein